MVVLSIVRLGCRGWTRTIDIQFQRLAFYC